MSDYHPELSGYEPIDNRRPLRSKRFMATVRIAVVLGIVGLIVPGILTTLHVAQTTASRSCAVAVAHYYPFSSDFDARFEFSGAGGFGWQCYAIDRNERETFVVPLGIIPSAPRATQPGSAI